jgi:S-adenosylmethionine:tRNA ribosyltransferase-isomerase
MYLSDFFYDLPEELIAKYPTPTRSQSRLLCLDGKLSHRHFYEILELIHPNDLLVLNNTKVLPARLYGQKESGGKIEILIEKILDNHQALVHCKASKRPKLGQTLWFENKIKAIVINDKNNLLTLKFEENLSVYEILSLYGHMPLPPYLGREDEELDKERYQTVYAKELGSVAAPTAGLHFDVEMLAKLQTAYLTLHVGAGTFQTVRVKNLDQHIMHSEYAEVSEEVVEKIKKTKSLGGRIIAVGTTTVRTLEQASLSGELKVFRGETKLFIRPGFKFNCIDAMITNFHLPESTLLMLVCAFGGYENVMQAYDEAVKQKYRFFSYGDAMFISRKNNAI